MNTLDKLLKNFSSNALGNIIGQGMNFLTLLYLPRVLGPQGYGVFNFAQSYLMYFILLSDLGISLFSIRTINQRNAEKQHVVAQEVFITRFYLSIFSMCAFAVSSLIIPVGNQERISLILTSISVFFLGTAVDYLFNAFSDMKFIGVSVAIKNAVFFLLCILFVKNSSDICLTSLAFTISTAAGCSILYFVFIKKFFVLRLRGLSHAHFSIIKQALPLAVSLVMVQINNNFDIIYLNFTKGSLEVGYYSTPYKIINFLIGVLVVYFNAAYPSIAEYLHKNRKQLDSFISKFYKMGVIFVMPIVFGGIVLSEKIIDLLFGKQFAPSALLFSLLLPLIFIRLVTSTFGAVLIMGKGAKYFTQGVIFGAIINIVLNIILTPHYGAQGSAVATIVCEFVQGIYLYIKYRQYCHARLFISNTLPLISSLLMCFAIHFVIRSNLFICFGIGVLTYFVCFAFFKSIFKIYRCWVNER